METKPQVHSLGLRLGMSFIKRRGGIRSPAAMARLEDQRRVFIWEIVKTIFLAVLGSVFLTPILKGEGDLITPAGWLFVAISVAVLALMVWNADVTR